MARTRKVIVFCGMRNTGKTTQIVKLVKSQKQRVLIYDINKELAYEQAGIGSINLSEITSFTGTKKIFHPDPKLCLEMFRKYLRNSLLVLEDANFYITPSPDGELWKMLVSARHMGIDMCLTFHSLARIPPWLYEMTNDLVLFKTSENAKRVIEKIPNPALVLKAWDEVSRNPSGFYFKLIHLI